MFKKYLFFVLLFMCCQAKAAKIIGTVSDGANGAALSGVVITVKNTSIGTVTDIDGKYEISGLFDSDFVVTYTYVTYTTHTENISMKKNNDIILDVKMETEARALKETTISSTRYTNTENSVLLEVRNAHNIVSGISAAQISKSMDRNAADVVKRIPGVTIQDDRLIVVRGLYDRYNTVWLNDAGAPSSEVDKKSFSFDIIPSGLIDRILIYKSPSPELPGDFAGGMVKIYTTSITDRNQVTVGVQTSSREYTTGNTFYYNKRSSADWLGYDKGTRELPAHTPDYINKNDPGNAELTKSFGNDWILYNKPASPDVRFNLALSNVLKLKKVKIGNTLGVSYTNTNQNSEIERQDWTDEKSEAYHYHDLESSNKVNVGLLENIGVQFDNSKIEFKNLYNQSANAYVVQRKSYLVSTTDTNNKYPDENSYAMGYESRATYASQLTGTHKTKSGNTKYYWTLGYTDLFKNTPDLRRIQFTRTDADTIYKPPIASVVDPINGGGRFYSALYEHVYSFNHMLTQTIKIKNYSFDVSAGNYIEYKSRFFSARSLGYTFVAGPGLTYDEKYKLFHSGLSNLFADSNVGGVNKFNIDEITDASDKYNAHNTLVASFVSFNLPVGNKIDVVGGVRYEYNQQYIKSLLNGDTITKTEDTRFLLPSVNILYRYADNQLVRAGYGKTLNRPEFREWSPFYFYDFEDRVSDAGSLRQNASFDGHVLKVAQIQNYDVRWELYPTNNEIISAGVYYKSFKDPIQRLVVGGGSDSRQYSYDNVDKAYCYGVELDVRKNLILIDNLFKSDFFKYFSIVGNVTLGKSELTIDSSKYKSKVVTKSLLQGQSPYVINFGLFYQNDKNGFQGSVLYNIAGARVYVLGTKDEPTIAELPFSSLDIVLSKTFHKHYILNAGIQNLLNDTRRFVDDANYDNKYTVSDKPYKSYKPGQYFTLGVKIRF